MLSSSCVIITRNNIQILQINNAFATAEVSLFGGHILSFKPKHDLRERFWLSKSAKLDGKRAIRGGVPVCWPWFGDHAVKQHEPDNNDYSAHGYVRNQVWQIITSQEKENSTHIELSPQSSQGDGFEGQAQLTLIINIGNECSIQLITHNTGEHTFSYRAALHSYFTINDIKQTRITGLSGQYFDKTRAMDSFETPKPYIFNSETDRVHLCQPLSIHIEDNNTVTKINSHGHDSMVVWNPWEEKSIAMSDMDNEGYLTMVCVETAVTQGQTVAPGEKHILKQVVF